MPLVEEAGAVDKIHVRHHLQELFRSTVVALAEQAVESYETTPDFPREPDDYLTWLCHTHNDYLTPFQQENLRKYVRQALADQSSTSSYNNATFPIVRHFSLLSAAVRTIGYTHCYILIDNIDELVETVADWQAGARMLQPLIGNVRLSEVPGLTFKYFIPTEVFTLLRRQQLLREDRIGCFRLSWDARLLQEILRNRLDVFSDGQVYSLASIAAPDIRNTLDSQLCDAARGSPRHLLNLGEWLLQACADTADEDNLFIQRQHLQMAIARLDAWLHHQGIGDAALPGTGVATVQAVADTSLAEPDDSLAETQLVHAEPGIPLLTLQQSGSIWRGNTVITGWQDLPRLQRELLQYLYDRRDIICHKEQIIEDIWAEKSEPASDDSLRKLINRLRRFIEPDPKHPVYIQSVRGGSYVLKNASEE
jgi:hypothetical protein